MLYTSPLNNFNLEDKETEYKITVSRYLDERIAMYKRINREDQR